MTSFSSSLLVLKILRWLALSLEVSLCGDDKDGEHLLD
jgi:hypothetical protein